MVVQRTRLSVLKAGDSMADAMNKPHVLQLSYVRMGVKALDWWQDLAALIGYDTNPDAPGGELQLRTDSEREYRIALSESKNHGVQVLGWETTSASALSILKERLQAIRAQFIEVTPEEIVQRKVEDMIAVMDPDGVRNEIFWGPSCALRKPFRSPTDTRFESGSCGNGHVTMNVRDAAATMRFYTEGLGFRLSDAAWMEGHARVYFLRCNARHHSLAFAQMKAKPPGTVHVMSDLKSLDDLGSVRDRLLDDGIALSRDLGSHPLDGVVSLYIATPEGFEFELACGTRFIQEENWESQKFERRGRPWGHRKLHPGAGA